MCKYILGFIFATSDTRVEHDTYCNSVMYIRYI